MCTVKMDHHLLLHTSFTPDIVTIATGRLERNLRSTRASRAILQRELKMN